MGNTTRVLGSAENRRKGKLEQKTDNKNSFSLVWFVEFVKENREKWQISKKLRVGPIAKFSAQSYIENARKTSKRGPWAVLHTYIYIDI